MKEINNQFNKELQQQIDGTLPKGHIYKLGYPGEILQKAGMPNWPIELRAEIIADKADQNYKSNHPFNLLDIKDLPKKINDPIVVFNSTKNDGAKIILTELKDKNNNNFVVIIRTYIKPTSRKTSIAINNIRSIYPKDNIAELKNWLKSNKLTAWVDKNRAQNLISTQPPNAVVGGNKAGSINKYSKKSEEKQEKN